jgi:hypothetical protein
MWYMVRRLRQLCSVTAVLLISFVNSIITSAINERQGSVDNLIKNSLYFILEYTSANYFVCCILLQYIYVCYMEASDRMVGE